MRRLLPLLLGCLLSAGALAGPAPATGGRLQASDLKRPVICIDPGHPSEVGKGTRGRRFTELDVAWRVAQLLQKKLQKDGYRVVMTKSHRDQFVRNRDRARIANEASSDLMVRLHCDAAVGRGIATYYPSRQGVSQSVKGPSGQVIVESRKAAKLFHASAVASLKGRLPDRGLKTDLDTAVGKRQGALTGSIFSERPVVLVEMLVLTNRRDEAFLSKQNGFERLAEALRHGVRAAVPPTNASNHRRSAIEDN